MVVNYLAKTELKVLIRYKVIIIIFFFAKKLFK